MTVKIEESRTLPREIMSGLSRYLGSTVIFYGEQRFTTFALYNRGNGYTRSGEEKIMVITKGTEFRPDLVAYDFYGSVDFWWAIMEANGIYDIWDFKAGRTIFLPNSF